MWIFKGGVVVGANRIKGITIEIGGDTTKLQTALTFSVSPKWLKKLTGYKQMEKIKVEYFDTECLELKSAEMYVEGFKAKLEKDTSYKGLWTVSFTLKEL